MERNLSLLTECALFPFTESIVTISKPFSCGDKDLDDFFCNIAFKYETEMLGKTYCWVDVTSEPYTIICVYTVANDSIKSSHLPSNSRNRINRLFSNPKRGLVYPATLIGRLGVNIDYQRKFHVGSQLLDYIKLSMIDSENTNACRFLVVDAYNNPNTLSFYEKNGFKFMHKLEATELEAINMFSNRNVNNPITELTTRMMYFDLKDLITE